MRGFAGIAPAAPPANRSFTETGTDTDLAAQLARMNAEAMAETAPAAPPEKRGGIFARLAGNRAAAPSAPAADAGMGDASMGESDLGDAAMTDGSMGEGSWKDTGMGDAFMGDAGMGDAELGIDPALAAQAFPEERAAQETLRRHHRLARCSRSSWRR